MSEGIYNKKLDEGKGTLVGNWQEERALREFTGVGRWAYFKILNTFSVFIFDCVIIRTITKEHIPK